MDQLRRPNDYPPYQALRERQKDKFVEILSESLQVDLSHCYLRGVDMSEISLQKVKLNGAYLHSADLRGTDLSNHNLDGCSIHKARISGVLFPDDIPVAEILMSLEHGTRIRVPKDSNTDSE